jgi:hypothetical protein
VPGHYDFRLFFGYDEIKRIVHIENMSESELSWRIYSPTRNVEEGLLLVPCNPDGFSKRIDKVMLTPTDIGAFLKYLPHGLVSVS